MASGSIRARSVARNIIDATMARTMSKEEVRRIAWSVSMSGVERVTQDFGYAVPSPSSGRIGYGISVAAE
jgi:hypothetical protein